MCSSLMSRTRDLDPWLHEGANECKHTDDIRHAANFEMFDGDMWEKETELATLEQVSDDE